MPRDMRLQPRLGGAHDDLVGAVRAPLGAEERSGARVVKAQVPLSEMFGYVGDLRSRTQGRANYSMVFDSYAEVPANVAKEVASAPDHRVSTPSSAMRAESTVRPAGPCTCREISPGIAAARARLSPKPMNVVNKPSLEFLC